VEASNPPAATAQSIPATEIALGDTPRRASHVAANRDALHRRTPSGRRSVGT
jgi:hypothetical protein